MFLNKWAEDLKRHLFIQRRQTDGQEAHAIFNVANYQINANQNNIERSPHTNQNGFN